MAELPMWSELMVYVCMFFVGFNSYRIGVQNATPDVTICPITVVALVICSVAVVANMRMGN